MTTHIRHKDTASSCQKAQRDEFGYRGDQARGISDTQEGTRCARNWSDYCYFVIVLPLSMGGRNSSKDIRATAHINDVAAPSQNVNAVAYHIGSVAASLELHQF